MRRSQSECSTNSSGEPQVAPQKKPGARNESALGVQENGKGGRESKILVESSCDYLADHGTFQKKKTIVVGLKKPIGGRQDAGKESSLQREQSNKNLNYSISEQRSHSVQKQHEDGFIESAEPAKLLPKTHHFTSFDHEKLGVDMCHTFHKAFIKTQSGPAAAKTQEEIQKIIAKFATKLAFKQVAPLANA